MCQQCINAGTVDTVQKQGVYCLEKIIQKIDCENCKIGRANINCARAFCKKFSNDASENCVTHNIKTKQQKEKESTAEEA